MMDDNTKEVWEKAISAIGAVLLVLVGGLLTFYTQKYFHKDNNIRSTIKSITEEYPKHQVSLNNCSNNLYDSIYDINNVFNVESKSVNARRSIESFYKITEECEQLTYEVQLFLTAIDVKFDKLKLGSELYSFKESVQKIINTKSKVDLPLVQLVRKAVKFKSAWDKESDRIEGLVLLKQQILSKSLN